jgi:TatD DNase family protein
MLIDTHCHLYVPEFDSDRNQVVKSAIACGVEKMFLPNIDVDSIESLHQLASDFPKNCFPMMGLHPCSVKENWESEIEIIRTHLFKNKYIAVGEIGLDLFWDKSTIDIQKKAFAMQIEWAKELKLPIVIHVRDAYKEAFEVVDKLNDQNLTGVFHCFSGTIEQASHIINYGGFKLGIGGVLTYKNSGLDSTLREIDMEHLVLETDAPYLAPVPYRGKRNESSYLVDIAQKLADVKEVPVEIVAKITSANALSIFGSAGN